MSEEHQAYMIARCLYTTILENVEHCGGEPEQAANGFDIGFVTSKIVCQVFTRDS